MFMFDDQLVARYIRIIVVRLAHNDVQTTKSFWECKQEVFILGKSLPQYIDSYFWFQL